MPVGIDLERHRLIKLHGPLVHRHQRPVGDHPVDLGHPLHDADAYLSGLRVAGNGMVVVGMKHFLVPEVQQRSQVCRFLKVLLGEVLQEVLYVPVGGTDVDI